jgi:hypothetical protein
MTSDSKAVARQEDEQARKEVATITDKKLLAQFSEMAVMIPSEKGGGTEEILAKILNAKTWGELDEPWETTDVDDIVGKPMRLISVRRRPSTFGGGLGIFLVINLRDQKTGQEYVKTTSSISVVGQIAWLCTQRATGILIEWCKAERPTENGFYPQHLKILDAHIPAKDDAA